MKAYSNDLMLKAWAAVDRRMARKGLTRQGEAHTREALDGVIPNALSLVKLEDVAGWFSRYGYEPQNQYS